MGQETPGQSGRAEREPYEPPVLVRHGDLAELTRHTPEVKVSEKGSVP